MAEKKKAILYLTRLICEQETHESGSDEIYFRVYCDGELYGKYPTNNNVYKMWWCCQYALSQKSTMLEGGSTMPGRVVWAKIVFATFTFVAISA